MHCKALDGLRGYAAMSVIIFHALIYYNADLWSTFCSETALDAYTKDGLWPFSLAVTLLNGRVPVIIFFILSGYVISSSIMKSDGNYIPFLIKRIGRIYPTVVACVLFTFIVAVLINKTMNIRPIYYTGYISLAIKNSLLLGNDILGVTWTLTVEMAFALIIYPLCILIKRFGSKITLIALLYSILAIKYPILTLHIPLMDKSLIFFICGILLTTKQAGFIFKNKSKTLPFIIVAIFTAGRLYTEFTPKFLLSQAIICSSLIGVLIYSQGGSIIHFLENGFSSLIGKISYSLYLFAVPVWHIVSALLPYNGKHPIAFGILSGLITVIISIPVSMITYKYIEKPSIEAAKTISRLFPLKRTIVIGN